MKKKLNLRNKIVRGTVYITSGLVIGGFYGWFFADIIEKLFM